MTTVRRDMLVKLVATVMLGYGVYTMWMMFKYQSVWYLLWAVPCFVGGIGLAMSRAWSQYFVYLVAFCTVAGWAGFVGLSWQDLPRQILPRAFALGFGLIVISGWSSVVVFRYFKRNAEQI